MKITVRQYFEDNAKSNELMCIKSLSQCLLNWILILTRACPCHARGTVKELKGQHGNPPCSPSQIGALLMVDYILQKTNYPPPHLFFITVPFPSVFSKALKFLSNFRSKTPTSPLLWLLDDNPLLCSLFLFIVSPGLFADNDNRSLSNWYK